MLNFIRLCHNRMAARQPSTHEFFTKSNRSRLVEITLNIGSSMVILCPESAVSLSAAHFPRTGSQSKLLTESKPSGTPKSAIIVSPTYPNINKVLKCKFKYLCNPRVHCAVIITINSVLSGCSIAICVSPAVFCVCS